MICAGLWKAAFVGLFRNQSCHRLLKGLFSVSVFLNKSISCRFVLWLRGKLLLIWRGPGGGPCGTLVS